MTIETGMDVLAGTTAKQIAWSVSTAVRAGRLADGARLPPIRLAAAHLGVAPATVSAAWGLLTRAGLIVTDGRRGTRVRADRPAGPRRYRHALDRDAGLRLDLSTGVPDPDLLPDLAASLRRAGTGAAPNSYLDDPLLPALGEVLRADWPFAAEEFAVVDGAMDGLDLVCRALLRFGDPVAVEQPAFPPLLDLLDAAGAQIIGVATDAGGPVAADLQAAAAQGARALFFQPRVHNPTGVSLTDERAEELAVIAQAFPDLLVVEDDSVGPLALSPAVSLGSRIPERTLHIRSYSKSCGPDLRLAAFGGPRGLLSRIRNLRFLGQGWTSRLLQSVLVDLLTHSEPQRRIAAARREYARRRESMVDALGAEGVPVSAPDGFNIWLPVADETAALLHLASRGIGAAAGSGFWIDRPPVAHLRVTAGLVADGSADVARALARAASSGPVAGPR